MSTNNQHQYQCRKSPLPASLAVIVTAVVTVLALSGIIVPDNVSQAAVNAVSAVVFLVSAVQTVVTFAAAYLKKDAKPPAAVEEIKRAGVK